MFHSRYGQQTILLMPFLLGFVCSQMIDMQRIIVYNYLPGPPHSIPLEPWPMAHKILDFFKWLLFSFLLFGRTYATVIPCILFSSLSNSASPLVVSSYSGRKWLSLRLKSIIISLIVVANTPFTVEVILVGHFQVC